MTIETNLISPTSRIVPLCSVARQIPHYFHTGGTVKLRSSNPFDSPVINPNFLSTDFDIKTIVAAIKAAKRFFTAEAWKGYVINAWDPLGSAKTDKEIAQYARNHATTYGVLNIFPLGYPLMMLIECSVFHAVGTAAMSRCGDLWGVLDPDLTVKGTKGLRVIDASALPYVPAANSKFSLNGNILVVDCCE